MLATLLLLAALAGPPSGAQPGTPPAAQAPHVDVNSGWSMPTSNAILAEPGRDITNDSGKVLTPTSAVPAACPVNPVLGDGRGMAHIAAMPSFSDIDLQIALRQPAPGAYNPIVADQPIYLLSNSAYGLQISARENDGSGSFNKMLLAYSGQTPISFPSAGCWTLQIESNYKRGSIVVWVAPASPIVRKQASVPATP